MFSDAFLIVSDHVFIISSRSSWTKIHGRINTKSAFLDLVQWVHISIINNKEAFFETFGLLVTGEFSALIHVENIFLTKKSQLF